MRFLALLIVLGFPVADVYLTVRFAEFTGLPIWVWLLAGVAVGAWLIRSERVSFRARLLASMHGQEPLLRNLLDSGRKVGAGVLFMLPGVVSDLLALALLMLPINVGSPLEPRPVYASGNVRPRHGDVLEGEYRRTE